MGIFKKPKFGFPWSVMDVKNLNDLVDALLYKITGNIDFLDMSTSFKNAFNQKVNQDDMTAAIETKAGEITLSASQTYTTQATTATVQATADGAAEAAKDAAKQGGLVANPIFAYWNGVYPDGLISWGTVTPTKETVLTRNGGYGLRFNVTASATQAGAQFGTDFFNGGGASLPNNKYYLLEFDFMLVSGSLDGAVVLLDWNGMSTFRTYTHLDQEVTSPVLGKWYSVRKVVTRPSETLTGYTGMHGFILANWTSSGAAVKDIIFDRIAIREATSTDISTKGLETRMDSAETKITPTAITNTVRTSTEYTNDLGAKVSLSALSSEIQQRANDVQIAFNGATGTFTIQNGKLILKNSANNNVMWCDVNGWLNAANLYIYGNESPSNLEIGGTAASGNKGIGIRTPDASNTVYIDFAGLNKDATFNDQVASGRFHRIASYAGSRDTLRVEVASKFDVRTISAGTVAMTVQGTLNASGAITGSSLVFADGKTAVPTNNISIMNYGYDAGNNFLSFTSPGNGSWYVNVLASDETLKENIVDAGDGYLDKIMSIRHRSYDWIKGGHSNVGYVIQELVQIDEDFGLSVPQGDQTSIYQLNLQNMIPAITKAMQEQQAYIQTLEQRITALEQAINI